MYTTHPSLLSDRYVCSTPLQPLATMPPPRSIRSQGSSHRNTPPATYQRNRVHDRSRSRSPRRRTTRSHSRPNRSRSRSRSRPNRSRSRSQSRSRPSRSHSRSQTTRSRSRITRSRSRGRQEHVRRTREHSFDFTQSRSPSATHGSQTLSTEGEDHPADTNLDITTPPGAIDVVLFNQIMQVIIEKQSDKWTIQYVRPPFFVRRYSQYLQVTHTLRLGRWRSTHARSCACVVCTSTLRRSLLSEYSGTKAHQPGGMYPRTRQLLLPHLPCLTDYVFLPVPRLTPEQKRALERQRTLVRTFEWFKENIPFLQEMVPWLECQPHHLLTMGAFVSSFFSRSAVRHPPSMLTQVCSSTVMLARHATVT